MREKTLLQKALDSVPFGRFFVASSMIVDVDLWLIRTSCECRCNRLDNGIWAPGCDKYQGAHFSMPVCPDKFQQLLVA